MFPQFCKSQIMLISLHYLFNKYYLNTHYRPVIVLIKSSVKYLLYASIKMLWAAYSKKSQVRAA